MYVLYQIKIGFYDAPIIISQSDHSFCFHVTYVVASNSVYLCNITLSIHNFVIYLSRTLIPANNLENLSLKN